MADHGPQERTLAERTVARVRDGLAAGAVPSLSRILELIRALTASLDTLSIPQLAELISQDEPVMDRVVGIANRLAYNPSGIPVQNIQHAIVLVGIERIRSLALSVMLMETAESQLSAEEHSEAVGLSLASALMTQELLRSAPRGITAELAFACAVLRNYGKLMLTALMLPEYEQAKLMEAQLGAEPAFRQAFGLTPLELGYELLTSEQLPPVLLEAVRHTAIEDLGRQAAAPAEQLVLAAELAVRICELIEQPDLTPAEFERRAAAVARASAPALHVGGARLLEAVRRVAHRCAETARNRPGGAPHVPIFQRLEALAEGRRLPPPSALARRLHEQRAVVNTSRPIAEALQAAAPALEALVAQGPARAGEVVELLLALLHQHLGLGQSIVFLASPDRQHFVARHGRGPLFEETRSRPGISRGQRDLFGLCLARGEDLLIQNPEHPGVKEFIPGWLLTFAEGKPVALLPLKDAQGLFGVVAGIVAHRSALAAFDLVRAELRTLREGLARGRLV